MIHGCEEINYFGDRQSGKTERAVRAVADELLAGGNPLLLSCTPVAAEDARGRLAVLLGDRLGEFRLRDVVRVGRLDPDPIGPAPIELRGLRRRVHCDVF